MGYGGTVGGLLKYEFQIIMSVEPLKHRDILSDKIYSGTMGLYVGNRESTNAHPILLKRRISMAEANQVPILTDAAPKFDKTYKCRSFLWTMDLRSSDSLNSIVLRQRCDWLCSPGHRVAPQRNAAQYVKMVHFDRFP